MRKIIPFRLLIILFVLAGMNINAQNSGFTEKLWKSYDQYKNEKIEIRRFKHKDLVPLLDEFSGHPQFEINKVGESIEGRSLNLISIGNGDTDVFLWSQMHGDESTATMAILDILNFFDSEDFKEEKKVMLDQLRIHFLPMLNPDGAEVFERRNALGVDVNRDALRLQSPESRTLKRVRDSLDADFGFNLHDQSRYYNAERTEKPATISFLAPAFNYEKDINDVRGRSMKLIVEMNKVLQKYAPGQVGRYNDDFEPRAFGDNIQKWGTSTVLIESGGFPGDREKQEIRKLNFIAILSALNSIATGDYENASLAEYETIPNNDRQLFDLKLEGVTYELKGKPYILDLAINLNEQDIDENTDFFYVGRVVDQGDLSTGYAYESFDASGYTLDFGKVYPEVLEDVSDLSDLDFTELLSRGVGYIRLEELPEDHSFTGYPVNLVSEDFSLNKELLPGRNATFFLKKNGETAYVVMNGFLFKPGEAAEQVENGLIFH
ncbi:M14 family zinc carboxypeptidase [Salegentibacter chungangensis]|uniref:M14 family zinc carboxypeptidase n=1 Tax=Salegentibacter chungangensis TaxID=1335724 RepID=A0ABW3NVJ3_9FLAO